MQVSYKWLKEYLDFELTPEQLAEKLTAAGVAVERVESLNKGIEGVVVAKILDAIPHPDSDHLSLCKVSVDGQDEIEVICGAPNVRKGQIVPFAKVGAKLPSGLKIKKAKIRGIESFGMICSANELGIDSENLSQDQKEGILILGEEAVLGTDIVDYLNLDDYILEFDLTPNRSDCLSVINIAREIAAILDKKIKMPRIEINETEKNLADLAKVEILEPASCYRYTARIVEGVQIKPSPLWLQHKLHTSGIRSINNVVDITNLVMLEYGQPLHAFDYNLLSDGKVIVRLAHEGEKITTLDGNERELTEEMLLISDPMKAVGIAGVMGGENTEIKDTTTTIFIESAYFAPSSIRKTATKLGLRTDASIRFEKGINIETVPEALDRAAQLMVELADGKLLKGRIDNYPEPLVRKEIHLDLNKVNTILGTRLSFEFMKDVFLRLDFQIKVEGDDFLELIVPPYRPDVCIAEDLIEEVARIYGYDKIPTTLPAGATNQGRKSPEQIFRDKVINILAGLGLNEMINYSFINPHHLDKLLIAPNDYQRNAVKIINPLSEEQGIMRTSLLPGLLDSMRRNLNRRNEDIRAFELGKIYLAHDFLEKETLPKEVWMLGIALRGKTVSDWQEKGRAIDFYYLKGLLDFLVKRLNIKGLRFEICADNPSYHPGRSAKVFIQEIEMGLLGELHPTVAENYDLPAGSYLLELNLEKLFEKMNTTIVYEQLPKYPQVARDLAIQVRDQISSDQLIKVIKAEGGELLKSIEIFDYYKGSQINAGFKSLAFSLVFQAQDRTLTDEEINIIHQNIERSLALEFQATLRV